MIKNDKCNLISQAIVKMAKNIQIIETIQNGGENSNGEYNLNGGQNSKWRTKFKIADKIQHGGQNSKWRTKFNMADKIQNGVQIFKMADKIQNGGQNSKSQNIFKICKISRTIT